MNDLHVVVLAAGNAHQRQVAATLDLQPGCPAELKWEAVPGCERAAWLDDAQLRREFTACLAEMLRTLYACPKPTIARVQGDVFAGGVGLVAACDMAVSVDTATYCLSEVKLGLIPATISPYVVRAMGVQASRRYFVTAERFSAQQAHAMGMVHEVCAPEQLDATIAQHVSQLVANGPRAVRLCKQLVRDVANVPNTQALRDDTAKRIADIRASAEGKEGLQSFLNKRPPNWLV